MPWMPSYKLRSFYLQCIDNFPVSYTHLDVYKRQVCKRAFGRIHHYLDGDGKTIVDSSGSRRLHSYRQRQIDRAFIFPFNV